MKKIFGFVASLVVALALLSASCVAFDGNDYDYGGGDYDWGGGDYDWGGGDDYDYGGFGFAYDDDDDDGDGSDLEVGFIIATVVVILIFSFVKNKAIKAGSSSSAPKTIPSKQGRFVSLPDRTSQIEEIVKAHDPNFSSSDFITFTKNVYIDIQTAWCKRDLSPVRPVLHENLYNTTTKQIQSKIEQGVVYHYESMVVNTAYLTSYIADSQFEYVTCYLNARMIDWQEDEKTGRVLRGDKTTRWDMRYKMKFARSIGVKTKTETDDANGHNCPNCGAPMEISSAGLCDYCGSVVTTGQYSWVLTDFMTVRDDTVDEGIRGVEQ